MNSTLRVLVVGRSQESVDRVVRVLESNGSLVTTTLSDAMVMDFVSSSDYDAVVFEKEVSITDRGYLTTQIVKGKPSTIIVAANSPQSVMTQLRQAFKEMERMA